jgi:hypothetical protein
LACRSKPDPAQERIKISEAAECRRVLSHGDILAVSRELLQMQLFQSGLADADYVAFGVENELAVAGGQSPAGDDEPAPALPSFELQRETARQILDDLLEHPADARIGPERHTSSLQSACRVLS